MKRGNWTDSPCFYISIEDGKNFALMAGPFQTHEGALKTVKRARKIGKEVDPKSHFYAWGTVKMKNGHREGKLNPQLGI